MKKNLVAALFCMLLPLGAFADGLYGGMDVYYASLVRPVDVVALDTAGLNMADFAFGGEARSIIDPFWGSAIGLYTPGDVNLPHHIDILLDAGLGLSLSIAHAGVGIGPDFGLEFGNGATQFFRTGANLRLTGDVVIGPFLLGLNWVSEIAFTRASIADAFMNPYGKLGVSLLYSF
ncbi:MAG: hypothetical protein NT061_09015 [Spirochaetes bacterium]|nr:hypothetical protein [Spirochaetota bacterium]